MNFLPWLGRAALGGAHARGFGGLPSWTAGDIGPSVWGTHNSPEAALEALSRVPEPQEPGESGRLPKEDKLPTRPSRAQRILEAFQELNRLKMGGSLFWPQTVAPWLMPNGATPGFPGAASGDEMSAVPRGAAGAPMNIAPDPMAVMRPELDSDNNPIPGTGMGMGQGVSPLLKMFLGR